MQKFIIVFFLLAALPFSASARYHGGGTHVSVGFGYGGGYYGGGYPYYPAYPAYPAYTYYPPRPVYVQPAPIVVEEVQPYNNYARPVTNTRYDQGYCREYTRNVKINNRVEKSYGTACQQPDGSWQEVN